MTLHPLPARTPSAAPTSSPAPAPGAAANRVLILTAGYGEGHNAAARSLAAGFDRVAGPDTALVLDLFALASPRLNAISRRLYLRLINDTPRVWNRLYAWIDRSSLIERQLWIFRREIRLLHEAIIRERPLAVCCTYPLYGFFLERLTRQSSTRLPVYNVVTDSISIHSLWWRAECDAWFLPNPDSADVLRRAGIDAQALHVCGFPVPAFFADHVNELAPPDLATGARPRVLHIVNSGTRNAAETARRLLMETDWDITCAVGRDDHLRRQFLQLAASRSAPTRILGWTDQIPALLMTCHVVVSKAGGATTQEAIAAQCPMIVSQVVPGQEEGNYELLRRHGSGARADTPDAVLTELRAAFADGGQLWRRWRTALRPIAFRHAADDIARTVLVRAGRAVPGRIPDSSAQPHLPSPV